MEVYNFYSKKYGIGAELILDVDAKGQAGKLTYQCTGIKDKYKGNFYYECGNGWLIIASDSSPLNVCDKKIYLCDKSTECDNRITTYRMGFQYVLETYRNYKSLEELFQEIVDAFEEIGNNYKV